jgi:hypothetical protein
MTKRTNTYKLTLEEISLAKDEDVKNDALQIEFSNHDNIFKIIDAIKNKHIFANENESIEFAIGLKMFSEVMIKNRNNELFTTLAPAFGEFMKMLKSK